MSEKVTLSKEAYDQIERMHEARVHYEGFDRLRVKISQSHVSGRIPVDLDALQDAFNDILSGFHKLQSVIDAPYELIVGEAEHE